MRTTGLHTMQVHTTIQNTNEESEPPIPLVSEGESEGEDLGLQMSSKELLSWVRQVCRCICMVILYADLLAISMPAESTSFHALLSHRQTIDAIKARLAFEVIFAEVRCNNQP